MRIARNWSGCAMGSTTGFCDEPSDLTAAALATTIDLTWHGTDRVGAITAPARTVFSLLETCQMRKSDRTQVLDVLSSGSISLSLPENLPFEDWRNIGIQLCRASSRLNWLFVDWWNFGEHRYGDRKALVESEE